MSDSQKKKSPPSSAGTGRSASSAAAMQTAATTANKTNKITLGICAMVSHCFTLLYFTSPHITLSLCSILIHHAVSCLPCFHLLPSYTHLNIHNWTWYFPATPIYIYICRIRKQDLSQWQKYFLDSQRINLRLLSLVIKVYILAICLLSPIQWMNWYACMIGYLTLHFKCVASLLYSPLTSTLYSADFILDDKW